MGSAQSNFISEAQNLENSILQASSETCIATCTNVEDNNTIIINGTSIGGNLDLTQQCKAQASCIMANQLDSQVQNIVKAMAEQKQTSKTSPFSFSFKGQNNEAQINQNITNSVTQIMNTACQSTSDNMMVNDTIVLTNDRVGGNFVLSQSGDATSNCTMNNLAKQVLFNKERATADQTQTIESVFFLIILAIIICLIVGAIIVFMVVGPSGFKKILGHSHTHTHYSAPTAPSYYSGRRR